MTDQNTHIDNTNPAAPLELRDGSDGPSHYLTGKSVTSGDILELKARDGDYITGFYQRPRPRTDQAQFFYQDREGYGVRSIFIATGTPFRWPTNEDAWTRQLATHGTLDAAEDLLHSLIDASTAKENLRDVATDSDFRKLLCQFQLVRRKA